MLLVAHLLRCCGGDFELTAPLNTDGWDTYRSSNIVIQNSWIDNGDGALTGAT